MVEGGSVDKPHLLGGGTHKKEAGNVEALGRNQVSKDALTMTGLGARGRGDVQRWE